MIKEIDKIVQSINDEIMNINCGGCCVFAESLFPYLESLGLKPQVKVIDFYGQNKGDDLSTIRKIMHNSLSLSEWNKNGVDFNHVVVQFTYRKRAYIVDSTGVFSELKFHRISGIIKGSFSYAEARSFSENKNWNHWFDRTDIGKIKNDLKKGFNSLFNNQFKTFSDVVYI